ncbi:pectinesterase-like [Magnolia sinica]|uniref:pectinesterase-like n=1 Tax=Magnolia sinica TaxID=86752 RepID=UPI00265B2A60|nr:pectinesterase-like [Magnolia sinica]
MPPENSSRRSSSATAGPIEIDDYPEPDPPNPAAIEAERRRTRNRTIILAVSSAVLIVTVSVFTKSGIFGGGDQNDAPPAQPPIGQDRLNNSIMQSKIKAFCQLTEFQDTCLSTISRYTAKLKSDDPNVFLLQSTAASIEAVEEAYNYSVNVAKTVMDGRSRWAFKDCELLLNYTLLQLQAGDSGAEIVRAYEIPTKMTDLLSGLSAAVTYQQTCMDGFDVEMGDQTAEMMMIVTNATKLTRNILSVVSRISMDEDLTRVIEGMDEDGGKPVWHMANGKADVVVAKDGSGNYKTIREALEVAREKREGRFVIYVKDGVYEENVKVTDEMNYITMYGDGRDETVVTGTRGFGDGITMYGTATFVVSGMAFMARDMGFQNIAGPEKAQAIALLVESDLSIFYNCRIDGYQNTLLAHTHRQFYRDCIISGTIDIISGDAAAVFQNCEIVAKKPLVGQQNTIMAQARVDPCQTTGFVVQNCTISAANDLYPARDQIRTFLGRPVKEYSRTVIMQSRIDDLISLEGWGPAGGEDKCEGKVYFAEFGNSGPGSGLKGRVTWQGFHVLDDVANVSRFTAGKFIQGKLWLNMTGVPFYTGVS